MDMIPSHAEQSGYPAKLYHFNQQNYNDNDNHLQLPGFKI